MKAIGGISARGACRRFAPCRPTKPGTIQRRVNAISEAHKATGWESPTHAAIVRNTLKGIRRTKGTAAAQKAAALTDHIWSIIDATDTGLNWCQGHGNVGIIRSLVRAIALPDTGVRGKWAHSIQRAVSRLDSDRLIIDTGAYEPAHSHRDCCGL
jgi:hypothetical protein